MSMSMFIWRWILLASCPYPGASKRDPAVQFTLTPPDGKSKSNSPGRGKKPSPSWCDMALQFPRHVWRQAVSPERLGKLSDKYKRFRTCPVWRKLALESVTNCSRDSDVLEGLIRSNITVAKDLPLAVTAMKSDKIECLKKILAAIRANESIAMQCPEAESELWWPCQAGWTLPHYAAKWSPHLLPLLKDHGYNLSVGDVNGWTPAHEEGRTIKFEHQGVGVDLFQKLAEMGARLDTPDGSGRTPAHVACKDLDELHVNVTSVLATIFFSGASVSSIDMNGSTPAHDCLQNPKALTFLHSVAREAFNVRNRDNHTPEQLAEQKHSASMIVFARFHAVERAQECQRLDKEVGALFECLEDTINAPQGFTILAQSPFCREGCAVKCPNPRACPAGVYPGKGCSVGYDPASVGCGQCMSGFGRSNQDPFVCSKCRPAWQMWTVQLLKPVTIYAGSILSAKPNKDFQSALFKMLLSFGTLAASIWPAIKDSDAYEMAIPGVRLTLDLGDSSMSATTQWHGPSLDCLLATPHASMWQWLRLTAAVPVTLMLVSFGILCWRSRGGPEVMRHLAKTYVVFINCFLPDLLGAMVRFVPCMHFQVDNARFASYDVTAKCPGSLQRYFILIGVLMLGAAVGPALWCALMNTSSKWPQQDRAEVLGFLTSGYKAAFDWWEAVVLTRKCVLVIVASLFPMSYSPLLFLTSLLVIMGTSLTCHTLAWPYENASLNQLELAVQISSTMGILATVLLTLQPVEWTLDYSVTCPALAAAVLLLLFPFVTLLSLLLLEIRKKVQ